MGLNARGGIALGQLIVYVPIVFVAGFLVFRHSIKKKSGWIFLLTLSVVRIVGSAIHIVAENESNPSTTLVTIYTTLENAGLSPLTLATLAFLSVVGEGVFGEGGGGSIGLHLLGLLSSIALALLIIGGVKIGNAKTDDELHTGTTFRHIGGIVFLVMYVIVTLVHVYFWTRKNHLMKNRRVLLAGISIALPFLLIRVVYAVLGSFSPVSLPQTPVDHNGFSKFSSSTGSWQIFLLMAVVPELLTVITYLAAGLKIPLDNDFKEAYGRGSDDGYRSDQELQPAWNKP